MRSRGIERKASVGLPTWSNPGIKSESSENWGLETDMGDNIYSVSLRDISSGVLYHCLFISRLEEQAEPEESEDQAQHGEDDPDRDLNSCASLLAHGIVGYQHRHPKQSLRVHYLISSRHTTRKFFQGRGMLTQKLLLVQNLGPITRPDRTFFE